MTKKDTWFDAFFQAVTSSGEFKSIVEKDWKGDLWKSLKEMWKTIKKAGDLDQVFRDTFVTPEAIEIWEAMTTSDIYNRNPKAWKTMTNEDDQSNKLDIVYPVMKNPETYGFKWIAWMSELKENLQSNFINPLKFKFLVEKLEREKGLKPWSEKEELYSKIYEAYKKFSVWIPTWLLFYGPPWTWKTFITKKLAEELWAWMIKKSVWEFGSSYIHATSKNIRDFFAWAKAASEKWPIILFLDEIDSLVSSRWNNVDSNKAEEVSQFLQEFNNLDTAPNLIVIAATNRPDHLDSAILRSGRFDKKYYIWAPDFEARKELFKIYIEKEKRPHSELDYEELAKLTGGYVAADIEAICDEVARDASKNLLDLAKTMDLPDYDVKKIKESLDDHTITMELLKVAISETVSSLKVVDMSIFEKWEENLKK